MCNFTLKFNVEVLKVGPGSVKLFAIAKVIKFVSLFGFIHPVERYLRLRWRMELNHTFVIESRRMIPKLQKKIAFSVIFMGQKVLLN